jgi:hypothetical protein
LVPHHLGSIVIKQDVSVFSRQATFGINLSNLSGISRNFFDPTPEQQNVVLIDAATLQKAQRMIPGCEECSESAELPFDDILESPDGFRSERDGLCVGIPAKCLQCGAAINERTRFM